MAVDAGLGPTTKTAHRRTATKRRARLRWQRSLSHGDGGEKGYSGNWKRLSMSTTVLAYLILFMGFITFLVGAFGVLMLIFEEVAKTERVPFQILRDGGRTDIRRPRLRWRRSPEACGGNRATVPLAGRWRVRSPLGLSD